MEQLSKELPDASLWAGSEQFNAVKATWMKKYKLSSRAFGRAVDFIKDHREFSSNIGLSKAFVSLTDGDLDRLLSASLKLLSRQIKRAGTWPSKLRLERPEFSLFKSTGLELSVSLVSEVNAIFYLGRDERIS